MKPNKRIMILCSLVLLGACNSAKKGLVENIPPDIDGLPQTIIYKTTRDFTRFVPVIMNKERTEIVSYPAPSDLISNGELTLPTPLADGYLLDNRGISPDVAFTSYTYDEYVSLKEPPSTQKLLSQIIEKYPLVDIRFCGARLDYKSIEQLNNLIKENFPGCEKPLYPPMQITE